LNRLRGGHTESVIQDVDVPIENAGAFLDFFQRDIRIAPVWICPLRAGPDAARFSLYPLAPGRLYVNFGFWDVVRRSEPHPTGHFNRMIEREVARLSGIKSLYSESFFPRDEFDRIYGGEAYRALKAKYDPGNALPDLYAKCVLGH
jgi:FAD/FMN-containing dehydrogenase